MNRINYITVHCSATPNDSSVTKEKITEWHLDRGWNDIGYHFVIESDGVVRQGRSIRMQGAHVHGHNENNIGICIVGGVDSEGKSVMNFTEYQLENLRTLILGLLWVYDVPEENILGHRDWSPDLDDDGVIERHEWLKDCPCFDVQHWWKTNEAKFYVEEES